MYVCKINTGNKLCSIICIIWPRATLFYHQSYLLSSEGYYLLVPAKKQISCSALGVKISDGQQKSLRAYFTQAPNFSTE